MLKIVVCLNKYCSTICLALMVIFLFISCSAQQQKIDELKGPLKEAKHSNGLVVQLPKSYKYDQVESGFDIDSNTESRSPLLLSIRIFPGKVRPTGDWPNQVKVSSETIWYRFEADNGGSGGHEYHLIGWKSYPGGYISFDVDKQADLMFDDKPDFDLFSEAWPIIAKASVKPNQQK